MEPTAGNAGPPQADLSHAGAVIDKAIEYMVSQHIDSLAIASALLAGALALLGRSMDDDAIEHVLGNAIASVRAGELRKPDGDGC
jgi:hypothetical protein